MTGVVRFPTASDAVMFAMISISKGSEGLIKHLRTDGKRALACTMLALLPVFFDDAASTRRF